MQLDIQPILENESIMLHPLEQNDFESLYHVASDPKIWEQHPNKDRYKKEVFQTFFEGAIKSKGAFRVVDKPTGKTIGCTRFYDFNEVESRILIGYTFYGVASWGKGINLSAKELMLNYIFQYVSVVEFHIGADNRRSQIAIERLGAKKTDEREIEYYGETSKLNFIYQIRKDEWQAINSK